MIGIGANLGFGIEQEGIYCVQSFMAGLPQQGVMEQENQAIPGLRHIVWDQNDQRVEYPELQQDSDCGSWHCWLECGIQSC